METQIIDIINEEKNNYKAINDYVNCFCKNEKIKSKISELTEYKMLVDDFVEEEKEFDDE